jgi:hypothetical protein
MEISAAILPNRNALKVRAAPPDAQRLEPESRSIVDPDLVVPTYRQIVGSTARATGEVTAALALGGVLVGGKWLSTAGLLAGLAHGNLAVASGGLLAGAATLATLSLAERVLREKPADPPMAKPAPPRSPSDIPGGETPRGVAMERMQDTDPDLRRRLQPGCYVHPTQVYTWGYQGPTVGHMHAEIVVAKQKSLVHARSCQMRRNVNLGVAASAAGAALLTTLAQGPLPVALGFAAYSGLFLAAARGCSTTRATALAVAEAHATTQDKLEAFGDGLGARPVARS